MTNDSNINLQHSQQHPLPPGTPPRTPPPKVPMDPFEISQNTVKRKAPNSNTRMFNFFKKQSTQRKTTKEIMKTTQYTTALSNLQSEFPITENLNNKKKELLKSKQSENSENKEVRESVKKCSKYINTALKDLISTIFYLETYLFTNNHKFVTSSPKLKTHAPGNVKKSVFTTLNILRNLIYETTTGLEYISDFIEPPIKQTTNPSILKWKTYIQNQTNGDLKRTVDNKPHYFAINLQKSELEIAGFDISATGFQHSTMQLRVGMLARSQKNANTATENNYGIKDGDIVDLGFNFSNEERFFKIKLVDDKPFKEFLGNDANIEKKVRDEMYSKYRSVYQNHNIFGNQKNWETHVPGELIPEFIHTFNELKESYRFVEGKFNDNFQFLFYTANNGNNIQFEKVDITEIPKAYECGHFYLWPKIPNIQSDKIQTLMTQLNNFYKLNSKKLNNKQKTQMETLIKEIQNLQGELRKPIPQKVEASLPTDVTNIIRKQYYNTDNNKQFLKNELEQINALKKFHKSFRDILET